MKMTTILFDLDGTLLPMDQDVFVESYFKHLAEKMAAFGYDPRKLTKAVWTGTGAMVKNDGRKRNEEVFWDTFAAIYGEDVRKDLPIFEEFYRQEFQQVREVCGQNPAAPRLIAWLKEQGFRLVLATNPLFPAIATHSRVRWAGLSPEDFAWITTYENISYCKPNPDYYREILRYLHLQPRECLMVGNDVSEDMVAGKLGMKVFLLTDCLINPGKEDIGVYPHGSFPELTAYVEELDGRKRVKKDVGKSVAVS